MMEAAGAIDEVGGMETRVEGHQNDARIGVNGWGLVLVPNTLVTVITDA